VAGAIAHQNDARDRTRLQNRVEGLLEEMRIKLSSVVSDLLGVSAWRMLTAIAAGETDAGKLAELADPGTQLSRVSFRFFTSIQHLRRQERLLSLVFCRRGISSIGPVLSATIRRNTKPRSIASLKQSSASWKAACPASARPSR
jgi:hypothetical protein